MRRNTIVVLALIATLGVSWLLAQVAPFSFRSWGHACWHKGGERGIVQCRVGDRMGAGIPGITVGIGNNSGGGIAVTDSDGVAEFRDLAEPDVDEITIDERVIMRRPYAYYLNCPQITDGLIVEVRLH